MTMLRQSAIVLTLATPWIVATSQSKIQQTPMAAIPFIGCPSDGQAGPVPVPHKSDKHLPIPQSAAAQLAYFQAGEGPGVLGPRNWQCFATYGSNGGSIYVSPEPHSTKEFFSSTWKGFFGPAIQLSISDGDTSGRFEVAMIVARVFPRYRQFVTRVIAENLEPATDFSYGPWPHDWLAYKNDHIVEYTTPAYAEGLGTATWLKKNDQPIQGVAMFVSDDDTALIHLAFRLPAELSSLDPIITHQVELESTQTTP